MPLPMSTLASASLTDVQAKLVIINTFVGQYTRWPGRYSLDRNHQVTICSVGRDEVATQLNMLEQASTEKLQVKVKKQIALSELNHCHVLYIAESEKISFSSWLNRAKNYPLLTISSIRHFVEEGGMVGLETDVKRQGNFEKHYVRYALNSGAVSEAGLSVEVDAIELAKRVIH